MANTKIHGFRELVIFVCPSYFVFHFTDDVVSPSGGNRDVIEHVPATDDNADFYSDVDERPYVCIMCPKRFTTAGYLRSHITRHPANYSDDLLKPYRSATVVLILDNSSSSSSSWASELNHIVINVCECFFSLVFHKNAF